METVIFLMGSRRQSRFIGGLEAPEALIILSDYDGLALFVNTKGAKCWHFRFSWADKQPRISLGTYPKISLRDARALREVTGALIARGIDPRVHRQLERNARRLATVIA